MFNSQVQIENINLEVIISGDLNLKKQCTEAAKIPNKLFVLLEEFLTSYQKKWNDHSFLHQFRKDYNFSLCSKIFFIFSLYFKNFICFDVLLYQFFFVNFENYQSFKSFRINQIFFTIKIIIDFTSSSTYYLFFPLFRIIINFSINQKNHISNNFSLRDRWWVRILNLQYPFSIIKCQRRPVESNHLTRDLEGLVLLHNPLQTLLPTVH